MARKYQCECGIWMGESCNWSGPISEMVVVEYMPEYLRGTHISAGNMGCYPNNGSVRVVAQKDCAEMLICEESDWSSIISRKPTDVGKYIS
jgi:hypothetical protein